MATTATTANLVPPTANLTESMALDMVEGLRVREKMLHFNFHDSTTPYRTRHGFRYLKSEADAAFRREWSRVMVRES